MFDKYAKAILGAIIAGLGAMQTAMIDGSTVLPIEWIGVATSTLASLGIIWGIGEHNDKIEAKKAEVAIAMVRASSGMQMPFEVAGAGVTPNDVTRTNMVS